ncbi:2'-5' RNA ligase family protein [Luteimonas vadosa]
MTAIPASQEGATASTPTDRLFLAILPGPGVAADMQALAVSLFERHQVEARAMEVARLHMTLHFLGDFTGVPAGLLAGAGRALDPIETACFDVVLDRALSFDGDRRRRPWVLSGSGPGTVALRALHAETGRKLAAEGVAVQGGQPFRPHVTLGYARIGLPASAVDPCVMHVHEIALVRSHIGRARHEVLMRWKLRPRS